MSPEALDLIFVVRLNNQLIGTTDEVLNFIIVCLDHKICKIISSEQGKEKESERTEYNNMDFSKDQFESNAGL